MTKIAGVYEAQALLGAGGIGRVYRAVHRPSGVPVALKTLHSHRTRSDAYRLLVREAAAAAQLRHPNVVELLDFVVDAGRPFLVLELVDGRDIEPWIEHWPGWPAVARAFDELLEGLSVAHAAGILHRDLKPGNLLRSSSGSIKITDFGMAEIVDPLSAIEERPFGGTPLYMAPEQIDPLGHQGPWTDLYAVGVMLYVLLSGREPLLAGDRDWIAQKRRPPPAFVPRVELNVPTELVHLIEALLDPAPARRPRFASEVRREFEKLRPLVIETRARTSQTPLERAELASTISSAPAHAASHTKVDLASAPTDWTLAAQSSELASAPTRDALTLPLPLSDDGFGPPDESRAEPSTREPVLPIEARELPFALPAPHEIAAATSLIRLRAPPLIARRTEQELLLGLISATCHDGRPRALTLVGEAGVGKSRLARWALGEVERTGTMEGTAAAYDVSGTTDGIRFALRRLLGPRRSTWSRWRLDEAGVDTEKLALWLEPDSTAKLVQRERLNLASAALSAACRRCPIYLWFDDVAWARDGALELIEELLGRQARLCAVTTVRAGSAEHPAVRGRLASIHQHENAREHWLFRFDWEERRELLHAAAPLGAELCREIAARVDATPLLLVQLVQDLIESGALAPGPSGWVAPDAQPIEAILETRPLVRLLSERVAKLLASFGEYSTHAEALLGRAALLGQRFSERTLRATQQGIRPEAVASLLARGLLHGILRTEPGENYRFEHDLLRDAVLERLAERADRAEILREVAGAILATHGTERPEVRVRVAQLLWEAGDRELALDHLVDAVRDLALMALTPRAMEMVELARTWVEGWPTKMGRAELLLAEGLLAYFAMDYQRSLTKLVESIELAESVGRPYHVARSKTCMASCYFYLGRFEESERIAAEVLDVCKLGSVAAAEPGFNAAHRLAEAAALRWDFEKAEHMYVLARQYCVVNPKVARVGFVDIDIADVYLVRGKLSEARELLDRLVALASEPGSGDWREFVPDVELRFALRSGEGPAVRARIADRIAELTRRGDVWRTTSMRVLDALAAAQGDGEPALVAAVEALQVAFACPHEKPFTLWALEALSQKLEQRGLPAQAGAVRGLLGRLVQR